MMTIIGYKDSKFTTSDGMDIQGVTLYLTEPRNGVYGLASDRLFVSTNKLTICFWFLVVLSLLSRLNR